MNKNQIHTGTTTIRPVHQIKQKETKLPKHHTKIKEKIWWMLAALTVYSIRVFPLYGSAISTLLTCHFYSIDLLLHCLSTLFLLCNSPQVQNHQRQKSIKEKPACAWEDRASDLHNWWSACVSWLTWIHDGVHGHLHFTGKQPYWLAQEAAQKVRITCFLYLYLYHVQATTLAGAGMRYFVVWSQSISLTVCL